MISALLSDENRWVNGQRIEVSGGWHFERLTSAKREVQISSLRTSCSSIVWAFTNAANFQ